MSDTDRTNDAIRHSIPGGKIAGFASANLSATLTNIASCAGVELKDGDSIWLYLGALSVSLPVDAWRPIIAALNAALAESDGTPQVSIPSNLDALMSAIEDAEALDGAR